MRHELFIALCPLPGCDGMGLGKDLMLWKTCKSRLHQAGKRHLKNVHGLRLLDCTIIKVSR